MNHTISLAAALLLGAACGLSQAQSAPEPVVALADSARAAPLPSKLDGHWVIFDTQGMWFSLTQRFKMDDIQSHADGTFVARLSWWSVYDRCSVEDITIRGTAGPEGMRFEIPTKCYTAEGRLQQKGTGSKWAGWASFQGSDVRDSFELTARAR